MAGAGTNIQPAFTTRKHAREKGKSSVCVTYTHGNVHACVSRPMEAARFHEQKCANNYQMIVAGVQRFLRHACAAHFRVLHIRKTPCGLRIYTQTLISVFFVHRNGNMHACLTRG